MGAIGHIVISDGKGGTVEAHSSSDGVIQATLNNRRWDVGVLVPNIRYSRGSEGVISIKINPKRITDINSRLLTADNPMQKCRLGQFLLDYLLLGDLRQLLSGSAPIILTCNDQAAQVYWELAAQPIGYEELGAPADQPYLGLTRGLTRQQKTVLAPAPESTPPTGRVLRSRRSMRAPEQCGV